MKTAKLNPIRNLLVPLLACLLANNAHAAQEIDLADLPLDVIGGVDPNVILTIDNSNSMTQLDVPVISSTNKITNPANGEGMTPLEIYNAVVALYSSEVDQDDVIRAIFSSNGNGLYYNPAVTYEPPLKWSGERYENADFNSAWENGFDQSEGAVNLESAFFMEISSSLNMPEAGPAFYFVYDSERSACLDQDSYSKGCYRKVKFEAVDLTDEVDTVQAEESEKTNFANWYSYYRSRILTTRSAILSALQGLDDSLRVGYQLINPTGRSRTPAFYSVSPMTPSHRETIENWLVGFDVGRGTPLRSATYRAGEYFKTEEPYRDDPTSTTSSVRSCRQNYHLLFSDGGWTADRGYHTSDVDGTRASLAESDFEITDYTPIAPYTDDVSGSLSNRGYLADQTFYYWVTDLRTGTDTGSNNDVPARIVDRTSDIDFDGDGSAGGDGDIFWNPANNPARWQHMVTYTIGFGVTGQLAYPDDEADLLTGSKSWTTDSIDDLWHAAINSRGQYFSAATPEALVAALTEVVNSFNTGTSSAAALSVNSGALYSGTRLYQAIYDTEAWTGDVIAYPVSTGDDPEDSCNSLPAGDVCSEEWRAATLLEDREPDDREILTMVRGTGGQAFEFDSLSAEMQSWLNHDDSEATGRSRLDYFRGDRSNEGNGVGEFRYRTQILSDIVNAAPLYVGPPDSFLTEGGYEEFKNQYGDRTPIVVVGSNGGMAHAFNAENGEELFAYVPFSVTRNLHELTDQLYYYNHRFFVDGPMAQGDVKTGNGDSYSDWKTVIAAGLGHGGQGVFALDVTNPSTIDESATDTVLWEFTDRDDPDLGYVYNRPSIIRVPDTVGSKWVVAFGNGYNNIQDDDEDGDGDGVEACVDDNDTLPCTISSDGKAALYLIKANAATDFSNSGDLVKVSIPADMWDDPADSDCNGTVGNATCDGRANGLATITAVDLDADQIAERIYVGDLFGNIWRIDLSASGAEIPFGANNDKPLFSAVDDNDNPQPITSKIRVAKHPRGEGVIVLFGTGKYLSSSDGTDDSVQTFYGIWDNGQTYGYSDDGGAAANRSNLLEQTITYAGLNNAGTGNEESSGKSRIRLISDERIDWGQKKGWYLDLKVEGESAEGERVTIPDPIVRNDRLIFVSLIPNEDPCQSEGADSWVNVIDYTDGSRLNVNPFDVDQNGVFGETDFHYVTIDGVEQGQVIGSINLSPDQNAVYTAPTSIASGSQIYNYLADATGGQPVKLLESSSFIGRHWLDIR